MLLHKKHKEEHRETQAGAEAPVCREEKSRVKLDGEKGAKAVFFIAAAFSVVAVFAIVIYLLVASIPAFRDVGFFKFLFKSMWLPSFYEDGRLPAGDAFGILPMILSSLVVTLGAVVLGGLLGICTAIFLVYYCPKKLKGAYTQVINLLAGIPSVVYGFFGLVVIVPMLQGIFGVTVGKGVLAAILVLSVMIMPTIASLTKNALEAVPADYYEGALALGNTKAQTIFKVCLPAAKRGIFSALILGVGRAVGETMAVAMVVGNTVNNFPTGAFMPVATMTTQIVQEMGYATGLRKQALIAIGFILLLFVLIINLVLTLVKREKMGGDSLFKRKLGKKEDRGENAEAAAAHANYAFYRSGIVQEVLKYVCMVLAGVVIVALVAMVAFILAKGIPNLTADFLFSAGSRTEVTMPQMLVTTLLIIFMTLLIALPIGIAAAIYLNEYSKKGSRLVKVIRLFIDTLAGIPSIVFGLFGNIFFVTICGGRYNLIAGSLTMVLIILPTIVRSTEESLREVPDSMREGSLALGAGKVRTIFKIVLPSALSGIVTSVILSIGRIVGESAALIYTAGAVIGMPDGYGSSGMTFAVAMYRLTQTGRAGDMERAYATAVVLLVIVVALNLLVTFLEKRIKRKTFGSSGDGKKEGIFAKLFKRKSARTEAGPQEPLADPAPAEGAAEGTQG